MYLVVSILQRPKEDQLILQRSSRKILYFQGIFAQPLIKMVNISASNITGLTPESYYPTQKKMREGGTRREVGEPQEEKGSKLDWHVIDCLNQMS